MVKVSQIKVPVVDVIKASGGKGIKNGIITEAEERLVLSAVSKKLGVQKEEINNFEIKKKSLDARKRMILIIYTRQNSVVRMSRKQLNGMGRIMLSWCQTGKKK